MAGSPREIQVDGLDLGGNTPGPLERWYRKHPIGRRDVTKALMAAGGVALFGAGAAVRDLGAKQQIHDQSDIIRNLQSQLDQEAKDKEQKIGEPEITWEVSNWKIMIPVDEVKRYEDTHPEQTINFTFRGDQYGRTQTLEFTHDAHAVTDQAREIVQVNGRGVYVMNALPGSYAPGMPANFYARITSHDGLITDKEQDIPLIAYTDKTYSRNSTPRVYSDEDPTKGGVDQFTLDELAMLSRDLDSLVIGGGPHISIQKSISPEEALFKRFFDQIDINSGFLKVTSHADVNYYRTLRAVLDVAFEQSLNTRSFNNDPINPIFENIQSAPLPEVFSFGKYVPSAAKDDEIGSWFKEGIRARNLPDILMVLRYFPNDFIANFKNLDTRQKAEARQTIKRAAEAIHFGAEIYDNQSDITVLIPDFQRIQDAIAA
ncbi:MAG TPA: hypothetical protein VLG67_01065 [Candidatus Saccharimonadales bacterium]|nr:hypothetical protein [Candidatus Saccharimonadales bacterium]